MAEETIISPSKDIQVLKEEIPKKKSKFGTVLKILSGIICSAILIILIIVKTNIPAFPLGWFVFLIALTIFIFGVIFFGFDIIRKIKEKTKETEELTKEKLHAVITLEQARELAQNALTNPHFADYTAGCYGEKTETIGENIKSKVYIYKTKGLYENNGEGDFIYIIINMHDPNLHDILINPSPVELRGAIRGCSIDPPQTPDIEEIREGPSLSGIERTIKRITQQKKGIKPEKKREELI
ncbi:MAG: hypothetical protein AABY22_04560 [Nanoarchaeota archaeon]